MLIKQLFDPSKGIDRAIEKVISYGADAETRLKSEISEYVATDSIEEHFADLLSKMQLAMEQGGENEVGVWVSGFYGSGKASERAEQSNKVSAGGVGFRYQIARRYGLHIGMDYAQSHEESAVYFNIGSGF